MGYDTISVFDGDPKSEKYSFSKFDQIKNLVKEFLIDYPKSKFSTSWFKSTVSYADVAGICCYANNEVDIALLDDLLGYIDIPANIEGFTCELIKKPGRAYFMVYDPTQIHPDSVKAVRIETFGKL